MPLHSRPVSSHSPNHIWFWTDAGVRLDFRRHNLCQLRLVLPELFNEHWENPEPSLEACAVLALKKTCLPGMAVARRLRAIRTAGLTRVVILPHPVKRQIVRR